MRREDKRERIDRYLQSPEAVGLSNRAIARHLEVSHTFVNKRRQALEGKPSSATGNVSSAPRTHPCPSEVVQLQDALRKSRNQVLELEVALTQEQKLRQRAEAELVEWMALLEGEGHVSMPSSVFKIMLTFCHPDRHDRDPGRRVQAEKVTRWLLKNRAQLTLAPKHE